MLVKLVNKRLEIRKLFFAILIFFSPTFLRNHRRIGSESIIVALILFLFFAPAIDALLIHHLHHYLDAVRHRRLQTNGRAYHPLSEL